MGGASEVLLGIDVGTASTKGVLARPDGAVVAVAQIEHALSLPRPGWAEHDAEAVWWKDVRAVCAQLLAHVAPGSLAGVCVSGIGPCLAPCDADLRPLRPAILYGIDTRAEEEISLLETELGRDRILRRGGSALSSQALGPKLLWLRRNEPETWARMAGWYMASSFVVARLTGEYVLDHHSASQCDPLYDIEAGGWASDWAEAIAPDLPLPRLLWPGEVAGRVTSAGAAATGIPAGTPVAAGTIDAWAEAFSAGVRRPGDLMLMYGSTMFMVLVADLPQPHRSLWMTAGVEPGTHSLAAGMATSGSLTGWLRELTGGASFATLAAEAAAARPGADGLLVLPYFAGERSPLFDPHARGVIAGLTLRHGRQELARAVYEATAFGVRHNLEAFREATGEPARVVAVGGGTKASAWTRIVSDATRLRQEIPAQAIGAAYGDALLAAIATGLVPATTDWAAIAEVVEPQPQTQSLYDELFGLYLELHSAVTPVSHRLARLQADGA